MNKATTLFFFILMILLVIYLNKPSGLDQELLRKEKEYKTRIDSIRTHYRELIREDSLTFIQYGIMAQRAVKAEENARIWEKRYRNEKANNNRDFTDAELDSLLQSVR